MTVQARGSDKHEIRKTEIRNKSEMLNSNSPTPLPFQISVLGICFVLLASDFELTLGPLPQRFVGLLNVLHERLRGPQSRRGSEPQG